MKKRTKFNTKRRISQSADELELDVLSSKVQYGGNPEHKRNPGDFGLTPPILPHSDKTICSDEAKIQSKGEAEKLLREGIRRGLISQQCRRGLPQNIWAVTDDGYPLEAQLENSQLATYHGYPMPESDPFRNQVIERWNRP